MKQTIFAIAPMMDWTDRHCRMFHRQFSKHALLYTEMVTANAIKHGDAAHLLSYSQVEHPVALQIGGSDPAVLQEATQIGIEYGYDEINLNVGCPSDRVQSGSFGAVLMKEPELVSDCVNAMKDVAKNYPITVKCRIGVDDQTPQDILPNFLSKIIEANVDQVTIHARMAWLNGLSPKENRDIPPLNYPLVYDMAHQFSEIPILINGGIQSLEEVKTHLSKGMSGTMIGRFAYHQPADILSLVDQELFGETYHPVHPKDAVYAMFDYIENELTKGTKLNQITRHMLGAFHAQDGARAWRRFLSEHAHKKGAGLDVIEAALSHITQVDRKATG